MIIVCTDNDSPRHKDYQKTSQFRQTRLILNCEFRL